MRISTWNCLGNFEKKSLALRLLHDPDIAVIQECSKRSIETMEEYSGLWVGGTNKSKGHAVIWKRGWDVSRLSTLVCDEEHETWIVAFQVKGLEEFKLIAVWAHSEAGGVGGYVQQIFKAFDAHPEWFGDGAVVVAGDFNSGFRWDKELSPRNHTSLVRFLNGHGLVSAYHSEYAQDSTHQESPTLHWRKDKELPFHVDYVFLPEAWLPRKKAVRLGCYADWVLLSDHCPLTLELEQAPLVS